MADQPIRFTDGAGYEQMMGVWSRSVGEVFLDWLNPGQRLQWADIGCGNGAFTELVVERCEPRHVIGVDVSPEQLSYARGRHTAGVAEFVEGNAMALPIADQSVGVSVSALVMFFVPDPRKGVDEMIRITRPGGAIAAYVWDFPGRGFPWDVIQNEVRAAGVTIPQPPQAAISDLGALHRLWEAAGLEAVESRHIDVERVFPSFDEFWRIGTLTPTMVGVAQTMAPDSLAGVKERVRARLRIEDGKVIHTGRASSVKGIAPA